MPSARRIRCSQMNLLAICTFCLLVPFSLAATTRCVLACSRVGRRFVVIVVLRGWRILPQASEALGHMIVTCS